MSIADKRNDQSHPLARRMLRWLMRLVLGVLLMFILLGVGGYVAILAQPQRVSDLAQMGLDRLQPHLAPYHLAVARVEVHVAQLGAPVSLEAETLSLSRNDLAVLEISTLHAELGLSLLPLPRLRLNDLVIGAPLLHANRLATGEAAAPTPSSSELRSQWNQIKQRVQRWYRLIAFKQMRVEDGRIAVSDDTNAPMGHWTMQASYRHRILQGALHLTWPQGQSPQEAEANVPQETAELDLALNGQPLHDSARITGMLAHLRPSRLQGLPLPEWLQGADYPISMQIEGTWKGAALAGLDATLQGEAGTFTWPAMFSEPLPIQHMQAKAHVDAGAHHITLRDITLALPETTILSQIALAEDAKGYGITIQSDFPTLPTDRLSAYWPLKLAPVTRLWAVGNIHRGMIHDATLSMQLRPEDLEAPSLPKEALRASMHIEGVEVRYLPTHPPARNIAGMVSFSGQDMHLKIEGLDYLSATHFDGGTLSIPSFDAPETALDAEFDLHTTGQDVAALFATPEIDLAKKLHLTAAASGTATGTVGIHAIIFSSQPNPTPEYYADQFKYRVKANLFGVGQPKFLGDTDIADARMELSADNAALKAEGTLQLNGVPAKLGIDADFTADKTVTKVAMDLPAAKLSAFGYPIQKGVGGSIGVAATMSGGKNAKGERTNVTDASLDLTPTSLSLPMAGLNKPVGEKAALHAVTHALPGGGTLIDPLTYQGRNAFLNGTATLDAKGGIQGLNIATMRMGRQNASIRYGTGVDGVMELSVRGISLDLTALKAYRDKKPGPAKASNPLDPGPIRADVQLDRLWLAEKAPIDQLRARLDCIRQFCRSADIQGRAGINDEDPAPPSPFALRILQENGARRFRLNTDNAGRMLSALDVTDHITGGALKIDGTYDDKDAGHPLIGKVRMGEFYVRRAPLLTKILSLTSPTGIVDALLGKGIGFDGMSTAFNFENGTIRIKEARASGSALGLTAEEGSIQLGNTQMQLKGTVIPAYMLNSMIGKIPLVGEWLMGGKGQGLIATRFTMSGTEEDPKINVNPLSILTPGFLRGVFDVFDKKEDVETPKAAETPEESTPEAAQPPAGN